MDQEQTPTSSKYWMSLEQWRKDPEFAKLVEQEFMSSPLQSSDGQDGWARREFLKLMGASIALTTFGCVRRPAQKIIPYAKKPADMIHGLPDFYASSYIDGLETLGTLVTTRDGRPLKIEGNPDHPGNRGGMSARAHAHILKLYDPDRFTSARRNLQNEKRTNRETVGVKWPDLDKAVIDQLAKGKVAMLVATQMSPTTKDLIEDFASSFNAQVYQYDDVSYDAILDGQEASFGKRALPVYKINEARYIVSINNDFLGTWLTPVHFNRQFRAGRTANAEMNKLVVFESLLTLTGTNADQRFRIRPSQSLDVVMALLHELIVVKKVSRYASDANVVRMLSSFARVKEELGVNISEVAEGLWANRSRSLVLAGGMHAQTESAAALQVAANFLNSVLDNEGQTVFSVGSAVTPVRGSKDIGALVQALTSKQVTTLIIHGSNPVYSLPASANFAQAMSNAEMVVYFGDRNDETGRMADFIPTEHHPLENWGDAISLEGVVSIQQATIQPLHDSRSFQDSLLAWIKGTGKGSARAKAAADWYGYLRASWKESYIKGGNFDDGWNEALKTGVARGAAASTGAGSVNTRLLSDAKPSGRTSGFELALYSTIGLGDSKLANVPWLQEFPDPVTKITWDNYACFSLRDAAQLKIKEGQHVVLQVGDQKLKVPAHVQPGQADGVVGLAIGFGRKGAGQVADGVGVNAMTLAAFNKGRIITAGLETSVTVEKGVTPLANTQGHHSMEGRQIVVEETLQDHLKKPGGAVHRHHVWSMWDPHKYPGNKWGMVIDLNTCTGCGACVIACQSENNIPTVGKRHVLDGREMHWLRIDRYYVGTPDDPSVVHQPLPCMHCDNAPCETVCPVVATVHSDEGTNDMIYNRCVGTRYCSNNCPYKVRRFNWFDYTEIPAPRHLALNPEVTVRHRGVMEKCTFCIHRIRHHKSQAKIQDRPLKPNEVQTACQQSCPTNAIIFGDLNNTESTVNKEFMSPKSYALLEELNTKPAVHYQVKVRNGELKGEKKKHHGEEHH